MQVQMLRRCRCRCWEGAGVDAGADVENYKNFSPYSSVFNGNPKKQIGCYFLMIIIISTVSCDILYRSKQRAFPRAETHPHIPFLACARAYVCVSVHVHMYTCLSVHVHMYVYMYTCLCVNAQNIDHLFFRKNSSIERALHARKGSLLPPKLGSFFYLFCF